MTKKTQQDRARVLAWIYENPGSTVDDLAASGLYEAASARQSLNAARCWARQHLVAMRCQGKLSTSGTGHRGDPIRYSIARDFVRPRIYHARSGATEIWYLRTGDPGSRHEYVSQDLAMQRLCAEGYDADFVRFLEVTL